MRNKEFGSDFNFSLSSSPDNPFVNNKDFNLFFSGRTALYSLLEWGIQNEGWKKVLFPSYYCHEVVDFVKSLEIQIEYFDFNPFVKQSTNIEFKEFDILGNVFINVDYFGLKKTSEYSFQYSILIDDLTHNLDGLNESKADYCFGSLRKILPIPCGGFLSSPVKKYVPLGLESAFSEMISIQKLTAMCLKTQYLNGVEVDKNLFRSLYTEAEESFSNTQSLSRIPLSALSVLKYQNLDSILVKKRENLNLILNKLISSQGVKYNLSKSSDSALGLLIQFSNPHMRKELRSYLISHKIYPAVLWPNQIRDEDITASNLILFLHVDFRYSLEEIIYLADTLNSFFIADAPIN